MSATSRNIDSLIRLLTIAQDRGDRITCILLAARVRVLLGVVRPS